MKALVDLRGRNTKDSSCCGSPKKRKYEFVQKGNFMLKSGSLF